MEPIQHSHYTPRKKNSAKVNVTISLVIHIIIFALGAYWAAHEGVLGKKLQELSVGLLPKEKKPEAKKEDKPAEQATKKVETAKPQEVAKATAPPPAQKFIPPPAAVEAAAPAPVTIPGGFTFDQDSLVSGDPVGLYKQQVETKLRTIWNKPDVPDLDFVAEVEMRIDTQGRISGYDWKKRSGNKQWDDSVKNALAAGAVNRPPPKGFPDKFLVRFDVQPATEPLISRAD